MGGTEYEDYMILDGRGRDARQERKEPHGRYVRPGRQEQRALLGVTIDNGFVTLPAPGSGMDDKDAAYRQAGGALTSIGVFG